MINSTSFIFNTAVCTVLKFLETCSVSRTKKSQLFERKGGNEISQYLMCTHFHILLDSLYERKKAPETDIIGHLWLCLKR